MVIEAIKSIYFLRKSKKILSQVDSLYKLKGKILDPFAREKILNAISRLQASIQDRNGFQAKQQADDLKELSNHYMPRSSFEKAREFVGAVIFALVVAIVVRQMWFENYSIPTGSMRPTLKESDFLIVSKTDFGLNVPLTTSHFTFDPNLVQRGSIVVWTGENMDIPDADTVYFYLFPGKKQFVKRLIGKPGDVLYFYGGKLYGLDKQGNELSELLTPEWMSSLEHIPFIHFEGKVDVSDLRAQGIFTKATFSQMGMPIARLSANGFGFINGETLAVNGQAKVDHYSDFWGMKNFAMARILTKDQLDVLHPGLRKNVGDGLMYLELTHSPTVKSGKMIRDEYNRIRPDLSTSVSVLPLEQDHLDRIMDAMTTCRFIVDHEKACRYGFDKDDRYYSSFYPKLEGVEDGTYEIQNGKAYRVYPFGVTVELSKTHPLLSKSPKNVYALYNLGIEFLTQYLPEKNSRAQPSRYAYFRNGDLCLLNSPIFFKTDSVLEAFLKDEDQKVLTSLTSNSYLPFKDYQAPVLPDGSFDKETIAKYGLKVPEGHYLMLGDNHAMSADCRLFGFVPESNLKGTVRFLFSPPGIRWGSLSQPSKNHFSLPNIIVLTTVLGVSIGYAVYRRRLKKESVETVEKN